MDCYDEILSFYNNKYRSNDSSVLWYNKYLVKLMKELTKSNNKLHVKNCLILLLNLFSRNVPDHYHNHGKLVKDLNKKEGKVFLELLKSEFNN